MPQGGRLWVTSARFSTSQAAASWRWVRVAASRSVGSVSIGTAALARVRSGHIKSVWVW